jgi:hypothetical protein
MEDCTPAENQEAFRLIRQHTTTPLAVGEIFNTIWDCKDLIQNQLIDYIRTTVVHAGGITHLRRIADLASAVPGAHRLPRRHRPVARVHGRGAALRHLGAQLRHPGIHAPHRRDRRGVPARLPLRKRRAAPGETPGHGVDIDEKLAASIPLRARLPAGEPAGRTARCGTGDFVIDLGSGDGRIVITAARHYGARGLGVEIVPDLVDRSREAARIAGVTDRAEFRVQDLFATDLSPATVITMYLLPDVNLQLRPRLLALKPGTRIVSHDWDMGDWKPDRMITLDVPDKLYGREKVSRIYLWTVPPR